MGNNSVKEFENKRWREGDQTFVFRHGKALEMVEKGQKVVWRWAFAKKMSSINREQ